MLGEDYTVLEAADGEEAVTLTRLHKPSLVLMDILMPGKDGYSACHEIKTDPETKSIPVVMVSAIGHKLNAKLSAEVALMDTSLNPSAWKVCWKRSPSTRRAQRRSPHPFHLDRRTTVLPGSGVSRYSYSFPKSGGPGG